MWIGVFYIIERKEYFLLKVITNLLKAHKRVVLCADKTLSLLASDGPITEAEEEAAKSVAF